MGLRASRSSSTSSLLSKLQSMAVQASVYNDAKANNDYASGLMTGADYLSYLNGRAKSVSSNTTAGLSLAKKIKSVKTDIAQNELATKIDLGVEDPSKLADLLAKRVVDEGIIEGTPEYNSILKSVVNLRDQSVNYEKKQKLQEYKEMKVVNPSMADKMWDDYLQTLPDRMSNGIAIQNAQNEAENFHVTRIKSELARAINETSNELKRQGVSGSALHSAMRDAYSEASKIAMDNGLVDYANTLDNYAFTSNQNAVNAAQGEMKSAGSKELKLVSAQAWDLQQQIKDATRSGNLEQMESLNKELLNNYQLQMQLNENAGKPDVAAQLSAKLQPLAEEINNINRTFKVGSDGKLIPKKDPETGQFIDPDAMDFVMVRDGNGNVTTKKISMVNGDFTFEAEGWNKSEKKMAVDPETGQMVEVLKKGITQKDLSGKEYQVEEDYITDANGNQIKVVKDENDNYIPLGERIGESNVYKNKKADGGYDFVNFDGTKASRIDVFKASEYSNQKIGELLKGSSVKADQDILQKYGEIVYTEKLNKELERQKQIQVDLSKLNQTPIVKQVADMIENPTSTPTYVSPTELLRPKASSNPPINQPIPASNVATLMRVETIAPGYTRKRKEDGGFDYFKGTSTISVDDLARETGTIKSKLLDPNATSFKII